MPRFDLTRFRSLLFCAGLCGSLLGLGAGAAFAEAPAPGRRHRLSSAAISASRGSRW